MSSTTHVRVLDAAPHAVLDEVEDHRGRLPVDPDRHRELSRMSAWKFVTATVIWFGASFDAADRGRPGIELEHDARPAAQLVGRGATWRGMIRPSSRRAAVIAETVVGLELRLLGDLDPRDRAEPADRIHDVEAIDRPHQLGIGGLHRSSVRRHRDRPILCGRRIYLQCSEACQ